MNSIVEQTGAAPRAADARAPAARRYLSLDVLRGLTVTLMIIVNTPGSETGSYAPLLHALWHGFTPTDWVFPTFLFVVGNALSFALPKYAALGDAAVCARIGRRAATIFALGFLLYWFPFFKPDAAGAWALAPLASTRIPGVLQRIALCFALAALILHFWKARGAWLFCALALLGHWFALAQFGDYTLAGNAGLKLDLWLLGERHLYHGEGIAFDPEGVLGTLPATVNVIAGYFAGRLIQARGPAYASIVRLLLAGLACIALGLCWSSVLPINKKLWTGSYVLYTVGLDLLVLPLLIFVIELRKLTRWTYFFEVFGKNTLFIYLLSEVAVVILFTVRVEGQSGYAYLYGKVFQGLASPANSSLLFAVAFMLACWLVAYALDRARIYIKV
ncbi:acyltransferase family protein [Janthinobacterium fluminis]|uniref:Heparan-alpha-glucosaminide N-acetyltransferase domain-containing protein n=1 Tax=Janthinobacterium fluminis TaxID=2987524 RepID=A0ABT5JXP7_9BURK|nr:heparan-alpha-glucosaminide N-acetyltransferase domain-containing protein [Janthinobacterium fluminis]MDC8757414.1 heparan-alpha-glucosaminide N-acetyltransferase domain-containing protein [Janthinobacterium fluminis]